MVPINNFAKFINDFMQVYLLSTCTYTDIMRPNFELKNANKATTTYPIISILAIIDHRGFKVFFPKLIFGPSIELKIDPLEFPQRSLTET